MFSIFEGYQDQTYSEEGHVHWTNKSVRGELLRPCPDLDLILKGGSLCFIFLGFAVLTVATPADLQGIKKPTYCQPPIRYDHPTV